MNTDKKNQHYLPKFYLRYFSWDNNGKQIGLYNLYKEFFFSKAPLKHQGSSPFFYGEDGLIEESLASLERLFAPVLRNIIANRELPQKGTIEYYNLLTFAVLTDLRNPSRINDLINITESMRNKVLCVYPSSDIDKLIPIPTHSEALKLSLSKLTDSIEILMDLEVVLLINTLNQPYISSDFPVVKYNQFLEIRKWPLSKVGLGSVGLQIFIPLNSEIMLLFYDPGIYRVGYMKSNKKEKIHIINSSTTIDDLNILQYINCIENIYFSEKATKHYIMSLHTRAKKYTKANEPNVNYTYLLNKDVGFGEQFHRKKPDLLHIQTTDPQTLLKIDGVYIHSGGKAHKLNPSAAQLRPHVMKLENGKT